MQGVGQASWQMERRKKRRRRSGGDAGAGGITVVSTPSQITATDAQSNGTTIATLSVLGGTGSYTFTLTSNPSSLFSISGNQLQVAGAPLSPGADPITIHADNGAGSSGDLTTAVVVSSAGAGPSLDFSDSNNSQFLPLI